MMQKTSLPTAEIPAPPRLPSTIAFDAELAGRRAYLAARDATRAAGGYSFQCTLRVLRSDRGRVSPEVTATETFYLAPGNKLAVSYASGAPGRRTLRRAVCNGESLLAVRFEERGKQTTREFSRLFLSELGSLTRALPLARLDPLGVSCGAQLALEPELAMLTRLWKAADGALLEASSLTPRPGRPQWIRRYRLTATKTLASVEEWELREGRTTYRHETYQAAPKNPTPFSQALPENYTEQQIRIPERPQEPPTPSLAPEAEALLARWQKAFQRYFTLHTWAQVATKQELRSADARPARGSVGYNGTYDLWLVRPDRALVAITSPDGFPVPQTLKADATQVVVTDSTGTKRTATVREGARLEQTLRQAVLRSGLEPLPWLLEGPPSLVGYDSVRALPPQPLPDGTRAPVLELVRREEGRGGRDRERTVVNETTQKVWLGSDGLPRAFETERKSTVEGYFERDQPPTTRVMVLLRGLTTDRPPPF